MRVQGPILIFVLALGLFGCAGQDTSIADGPAGTETGAAQSTPALGGDLLDGVPSSCSLPADTDAALHERLLAAMGADVDHGPLVVVEVEGERVVATTTYTSPGVEGPAAVWHVDDEPVAINDEAARVSTAEARLRDSAGTDAIARARAEAEDCSWIAADRSAPDPPEPEPTMAEDLMVADPSTARPGDRVAVRFPEHTDRGIAFHLERLDGDDWTTTHWMVSDANGGEPATVPEGTDGFGWEDVGITGPGPDHIELPADLEPGSYRICTGNAVPDICTPLHVDG